MPEKPNAKFQWQLVTEQSLITRVSVALARIKEGSIDTTIFEFPLFECGEELENKLIDAADGVIIQLLDGSLLSTSLMKMVNGSRLRKYKEQSALSLTGVDYPDLKRVSGLLGIDGKKLAVNFLEAQRLEIGKNVVALDTNEHTVYVEGSTLEDQGYEVASDGRTASLPMLAKG